MSRGIFSRPINPNIYEEAKILGIIPIMLNFIDLNKIKNIIKIAIRTNPRDLICEENNDDNILLYKTNNPFTLYSSILLIDSSR